MSNTIEKTFKWKTLEHNGVAFPTSHILKGFSIKINNERLALNNEQEEIVYAWAKKKDTHYIEDAIFQNNFLSDLKKNYQLGSRIQIIYMKLIFQKLLA